jgi:N-acetylmuramoyl-L-alanine amidase
MISVCLDAGHGQHDPGAIGQNGTKEKDITLSITLKLGKLLGKQGLNVIYTRINDNPNFPQDQRQNLAKRVGIANTSEVDYFISIHCNSSNDKQAHGVETYCYKLGGNGEKLAKSIQESIINNTSLYNRGVKTANFYVIKYTQMPAVLIEMAFISNLEEEKLLKDEIFQDKIAIAIAKGICNYLNVPYIDAKYSKYFKDIPANYWAIDIIDEAYELGLVKGYSDGNFRPNTAPTRAELTSALLNLYKKIRG